MNRQNVSWQIFFGKFVKSDKKSDKMAEKVRQRYYKHKVSVIKKNEGYVHASALRFCCHSALNFHCQICLLSLRLIAEFCIEIA